MSNLSKIRKSFEGLAKELKMRFPDADINLEIEENNGTYNVSLVGLKPGVSLDDNPLPEDTYFTMYREIFPGKWMNLELFVIDESAQGKGIAKLVHKAHFELAQKLKIPKMDLYANCDVGGYAWIRSGFIPTKPKAFQRSLQINWAKKGSGQKLKPLLDELMLVSPEKAIEMVRANPSRYKSILLGTGWDGKLDLTDDSSLDYYKRWLGADAPITRGVSPHLLNEAAKNQVYLERLKAGLIRNIDPTLRSVDRGIREILSKLTVDQINQLSKKDLNDVLRQLAAKVGESYQEFTEQLLEELSDVSEDVMKREVGQLNAAMANATASGLASGVAWTAALDTPIAATGDMLESFIKDVPADEIKRIEREIRKSVTNGRTVQQTITAIRGTKAQGYKDGILNKSLNNLRTVVRTSTQHVYSETRFETWRANSDIIDGYQWVSTLDGHTSQICRSLDNQVFELGKGPKPPIHPNCRSTTTPYFSDGVDLWDADATRSSMTGYVPQGTTYYSWLKDQTPEFIADAIGSTRAQLFLKGGLSPEEFADLQLGKNFEPLTLAEMRKIKPSVFKQANL